MSAHIFPGALPIPRCSARQKIPGYWQKRSDQRHSPPAIARRMRPSTSSSDPKCSASSSAVRVPTCPIPNPRITLQRRFVTSRSSSNGCSTTRPRVPAPVLFRRFIKHIVGDLLIDPLWCSWLAHDDHPSMFITERERRSADAPLQTSAVAILCTSN